MTAFRLPVFPAMASRKGAKETQNRELKGNMLYFRC